MDIYMVIPYFYQYTVGSVVFFGGLYLSYRSGSLNLSTPEGRWTFAVLLAGMAFFASLHALLQFVFPFAGV